MDDFKLVKLIIDFFSMPEIFRRLIITKLFIYDIRLILVLIA